MQVSEAMRLATVEDYVPSVSEQAAASYVLAKEVERLEQYFGAVKNAIVVLRERHAEDSTVPLVGAIRMVCDEVEKQVREAAKAAERRSDD